MLFRKDIRARPTTNYVAELSECSCIEGEKTKLLFSYIQTYNSIEHPSCRMLTEQTGKCLEINKVEIKKLAIKTEETQREEIK